MNGVYESAMLRALESHSDLQNVYLCTVIRNVFPKLIVERTEACLGAPFSSVPVKFLQEFLGFSFQDSVIELLGGHCSTQSVRIFLKKIKAVALENRG